jgi:hypothetical protein
MTNVTFGLGRLACTAMLAWAVVWHDYSGAQVRQVGHWPAPESYHTAIAPPSRAQESPALGIEWATPPGIAASPRVDNRRHSASLSLWVAMAPTCLWFALNPDNLPIAQALARMASAMRSWVP